MRREPPEPLKRPSVPPGPYLVVGLGRAGVAAAGALRELPGAPEVRAWDAVPEIRDGEPVATLRARGVEIAATDAAPVPRSGCLVKSPGVPFDVAAIARAVQAGVPVIDELELGWRLAQAPMIGVTGTNGKSTVSTLIAAAARAGPVVGNTDFGPPLSAVAPGERGLLVCEVSSYQLEGSPELLPEAAVLTNLRPDHLQRHGGLEEYAACKRRLFVRGERCVGLAVVNAEDALGRALAADVGRRGGTVLRFGSGADADFRLRDCGWTLTRAWLDAETPDGPLRIRHRLPGVHNAENVLAAVASARGLGVGWEEIVPAIERTAGVPGRFEAIDEGQPFDAVVDFAHTPDAVEAVLRTARGLVAARRGRVVVAMSVSGARPGQLHAPIGAACARLADRVIVTSGSPRTGTPATTIEPLFAGAREAAGAPVEMVRDRRLAIRAALASAGEGDCVLVLGRGARPRLRTGLSGGGPAFDDRVVVREELRRLAT